MRRRGGCGGLWLVMGALLVLGLIACDDSATKADAAVDAGGDATPIDTGIGDTGAAVDQGPAPDGTTPPPKIEIQGLTGPVVAVYDDHGILHLTCKTDEDCMAALGYFHAANRMFTMDFARRLMRGRLGELVKAGDLVLQSDYLMRHMMTTRDGTPLEQDALTKMSASTLKAFSRYADGINAWIADLEAGRNGARLPAEYSFPLLVSEIARWEPADSVAVALYLMNDLGNTVEAELAAGEIAARVTDPALVADLLDLKPAFPVFTTTSAGLNTISYASGKRDLSRFVGARDALRQARQRIGARLRGAARQGSNNWVLAPSQTTANKALLCNDPHLGLSNPSVFMPVELDSKSNGAGGTLHVAGASAPGIPVVLIGRNESLAWGVTTAFYDLNEVYLEKLNAARTAVIYKGQEVPLLTKTFSFGNAAGQTPAEQTVKKELKWVPHHGPVIAIDEVAGTAISVRWSAHDGVTDADAFVALMRAASVADVPKALEKITAADQSFIVADLQGNIGWFPYARMPARPWASLALPPWLPVPGDDGVAEWDSFLDPADLPQATNPPQGFLATANQPLTDALADGDPTNGTQKPVGQRAFQSWDVDPGPRMARIVSLIEASSGKHTVDTMLAIQRDVYSEVGKIVAPALLDGAANVSLDADATQVVDALKAWKYTCPTGLAGTDAEGAVATDAAQVTESVGCTAFHVALYKLVDRALGDELKQADVTVDFDEQLKLIIKALVEPATIKSSFWDDVTTTTVVEAKGDQLRAALTDAGALLVAWKPPAQWQWGRVHTLTMRSIFDQFGVPSYNEGPFANDGAYGTVDVGKPNSPKLELQQKIDLSQTSGAALRMVVELDSQGMAMKFQLPGGTTMLRDSVRYNQLLERYLKNEPIDFAFGPGAVKNPQETLQLNPAP